MNIIFNDDPTGNSYDIEVYNGQYSGGKFKIVVSRDCYNDIILYEYNHNNKRILDRFESFTIRDLDVAKKIAKAILKLSKSKFKLEEPY